MYLRPLLAVMVLALSVSQPLAQEGEPGGVDVDFLFNYYDQDGNRSAVTGGQGTEDLQVLAPTILVNWQLNEAWTLGADLGVDNITSASTDNIDTNVSSASRLDNRVFISARATRSFTRQRWTVGGGFSREYDYASLHLLVGWSMDFNSGNTTFNAGLRHFADDVELYDIDGIVQGEDERTTTDISVGVSQVLGPRTVASFELNYTDQSGFLSTPFHEVILDDDSIVTEMLPDSRTRLALGVKVNHHFPGPVVQRFSYRLYDDDWGMTAQTIEAETHFRVHSQPEIWVYPILRFHTQSSNDYHGEPRTFTAAAPFFTSDPDLREFDSTKLGAGMRLLRGGGGKWFRSVDVRLTTYSRDDGLNALSVSMGLGWSF